MWLGATHLSFPKLPLLSTPPLSTAASTTPTMATFTATRTNRTARGPRFHHRPGDTSTGMQRSVRDTLWMLFSSWTDGRGGKRDQPEEPLKGTPAANAVKHMPRPRIWAGTSRHTEALTARWPRNAPLVEKSTCPCRRWPCTCWPTTSSTSATCVAKPSVDRGSYKATWDRTRARNRSAVPTAGKLSPTAQTCVLTCKRTRPSSTTSVNAATRRSHSRVTWISTTSRPASRGLFPLWALWMNDQSKLYNHGLFGWIYLLHCLYFQRQAVRFPSEDHEATDENRLKTHLFLPRPFQSLLYLLVPHQEVEWNIRYNAWIRLSPASSIRYVLFWDK